MKESPPGSESRSVVESRLTNLFTNPRQRDFAKALRRDISLSQNADLRPSLNEILTNIAQPAQGQGPATQTAQLQIQPPYQDRMDIDSAASQSLVPPVLAPQARTRRTVFDPISNRTEEGDQGELRLDDRGRFPRHEPAPPSSTAISARGFDGLSALSVLASAATDIRGRSPERRPEGTRPPRSSGGSQGRSR